MWAALLVLHLAGGGTPFGVGGCVTTNGFGSLGPCGEEHEVNLGQYATLEQCQARVQAVLRDLKVGRGYCAGRVEVKP